MSELLTLAVAALLYTALAMWAASPPYTCAMIPEPHRRLHLDRNLDREHLERDALAASRTSRRYALHLTANTQNSASDVDRVVEQCQATLSNEIVATHGVTLDQMVAALSTSR